MGLYGVPGCFDPHASLGLLCGLYQFVPQTEGIALLFESEWLL